MIKVALLAPIDNSLYARLVAHELLKLEDVRLTAIIVRNPWNWRRFRSEFARDGARLLGKIQRKLILGDERFNSVSTENLLSLAQETGLRADFLKELALQNEIPYRVVRDHNDPASARFLLADRPDVIAFTGGGLIRKDVLAIPGIGVMNCHTGILPQYRGMDVVEWTAVEIGFGATLHLMDQGVDSGPILLKRTITPNKGDGFNTIRQRLEVLMVKLMIEGVCGLRDGTLEPQPQRADAGRQYYVMHPRLKLFAEKRLACQLEK